MKLYKRLAVILAGSVMAVGFSSTWAYYSDSQSIVNPFDTANSSIDLIEDFNPADTILPGETVDKKPYFFEYRRYGFSSPTSDEYLVGRQRDWRKTGFS